MNNQQGNALLWGIVIVLAVTGVIYFVTQQPVGEGELREEGAGEVLEELRAEVPNKVLKIGVVVPRAGDVLPQGRSISNAVLLAAKTINENGGTGVVVEIIFEDSQCDKETAAAAADKLIRVDGVKFIVGGVCPGEALAMALITQKEGVLLISPSATSTDITSAGDLVFRTTPSDVFAGLVAAEYAYTGLEAETAAIISETTDDEQGLRLAFDEHFRQLGGEVLIDEVYSTGDTDFTAQILKIKNKDPKVVYVIPQTSASGVLIVKQLQANNIDTVVLSTEIMASSEMLKDNPVVLQGIMVIEPHYDQETEAAIVFLASYSEVYGSAPEHAFFSASAYSDIFLIAEGVQSVGYDPVAVADYFINLGPWSHALGTITFDENGDVTSAYLVKKAVDAKFEDVKVVE